MSYDPTIGRFISEDPIAFDGGDANLYRYVENDPVGAIDPSGDEKIEIIYSPLSPLGYYHGTVVVTDPTTGKKTYYRGGPTSNPLGGGSSASSGGTSSSSGGASSGSSCGSSGSNSSNSSNSSSPGSSPAKPGGRTGPFGPIKCVYGPYVPGSIDYPASGDPSLLPSVTVVDTPDPAGPTNDKLRRIFDGYNNSNYPYNPINNNSNTAAHQSIEDLGRPRPMPPVWAPGSGGRLR